MNSREVYYLTQKRSRSHSYFFLNGDRFDFNKQIGKGSFGIVSSFTPSQKGLHVNYAVKKASDTDAEPDLIREAKAWSLVYPNKSIWIGGETKRLIMPKIQGELLADALYLDLSIRLKLLIATAIELNKTFHARGFVHGDIKVNNIIVDGDRIFFIDLGQTYQVGKQTLGFTSYLSDVSDYLAPERLNAGLVGDPSQDVFSFGKMTNWLGVRGIKEITAATDIMPARRPTLANIIQALNVELLRLEKEGPTPEKYQARTFA